MALLEKKMVIKKSSLPGAGKGLFTTVFIPKGTRIVEYKGQIVSWKEVEKMADDRNGYVFFFNNQYCIDAWKTKKGIAHYANDAQGLVRIEGVKNNAEYVTEKKRCYIEAARDIPAGSEILVGYGGEYWQAIRYNIRLEQRTKEKEGKKASKKVELPHHKATKRVSKKK
ncbi:MAG TPA: SET domain-containing protein [Cyclobacteriaceae bacterium]|jgi:SET domain-containing protein|nr:SET domain-containing protein [Cytophagales bacterium]HRE65934.1 SET domain-containing protein [Cyclobacteriaceae bacterium]HRF34471.1 SET domain-containing protein [Cyclobacteriaceae bacterium]